MKKLLKRFFASKNAELSYHDVVVVVDGITYPMTTGSFDMWLACCRVTGWVLYNTHGTGDMKQWTVVGGEYNNNKQFEIWSKGNRII